MKWAVSPFSANPHSGRRCHLKSMLVSSVHIPKAARRRKFRSNGRDSHCTVGAPRKSKLRRKQKLDNQLTQWTATNPFLKRLLKMVQKKNCPKITTPNRRNPILSSSWNHQDQEEEHYGDSAPNLTLRFSIRVYYYGFLNHQPHVRIYEILYWDLLVVHLYRGWLNTHENYHKRS